MAKHNIETAEFKVTHSVDGDGVGTATIEATGEDFVSFRLKLTDKEVAKATEGTFQKTSALVKNAKILLCESKESPVLTVKKSFEKEGLVLVFSAEFLEASFTLVLLEVESSALELLAKRVERLESRLPRVVYEARTNGDLDEELGENLLWQSRPFVLGGVVVHSPTGPTIQQPGTYQILVSFGTSDYDYETYLQIDDVRVAKGFNNIVFVTVIGKGQKVSVTGMGGEDSCILTLMKWD